MAVDTTIRFNDHNSYKITSILMSYPFGVQNMTHITHSFQAYATTALASATRARTKFLDADGATINDVSHSFAVTQVFGKVEITVAVPATATQAQLVLLRGGTDWWVAETKTEQGEVATPYNVNYQGQVSHLTPNGLYTAMVTTGQIVVTGSVSQPDETLDTRLVTINSNAINLSSTVSGLSSSVGEQETRVTTIEADQITLTSTVNGISPKVTKITAAGIYTGTIAASQITAGYLSADRIQAKTLTGAKLADGTVQALQIAAGTITADRIAAETITGAKLADGTISDVKIASGLSATKITTGYISADRISAKSITGAKLADGTVDTLQIAASAITAEKIAAGTITADKINVSNLFAQNVTATGTITSLKLTSPAITGGSLNIGSGKFTVDSSGNLTATSATITGTLQAGSVVNGSLNSTTGTHTGSTTGGHTGTVNSSSIAGTLASTGGRHDGRVYSSYGSLGGVDFTSSSGYLQFSGRVVGTSGLTSSGVLYANYTAGTYSIIAADWISCVGVYESSDERLKQGIVSADSSLAQSIYDLPLIEYAFKRHPDKRQIGVNANQVVKVMPRKFSDLVVGTNDGYFNVNYTGLNTMAILAIQDLNKRVRALESA